MRSVLPCVLVSCLWGRERKSRSVGTGWNSALIFFAGKFLVLGPKTIFFYQKSHTLRFSIVWLVGWFVVIWLAGVVEESYEEVDQV